MSDLQKNIEDKLEQGSIGAEAFSRYLLKQATGSGEELLIAFKNYVKDEGIRYDNRCATNSFRIHETSVVISRWLKDELSSCKREIKSAITSMEKLYYLDLNASEALTRLNLTYMSLQEIK